MLQVSPVVPSNVVQMCSTQIRKKDCFGDYNGLSHLMFHKYQVVKELTISLKGMAMMSYQKVLNPQKGKRTDVFGETSFF